VVAVNIGPLRRELFNSTPPAEPTGTAADVIPLGTPDDVIPAGDDPTAIPTGRPAPGTVTLDVLITAHAPSRTVLTGDLAPGRRGQQRGRHKWRPGEPLEWRPVPTKRKTVE
jgi:hypothetical protein